MSEEEDKDKDDVRRLGSETQEMNETGERNRSEGGKDFKNEKYQSLENRSSANDRYWEYAHGPVESRQSSRTQALSDSDFYVYCFRHCVDHVQHIFDM